MKTIIYALAAFLSSIPSIYAQGDLDHCWTKLNEPMKKKVVAFSFTESREEIGQSYRPWDKANYTITGTAWIDPENLCKEETMSEDGKLIVSKLQYSPKTMLLCNYGSDTLSTVTTDQHLNQLCQSARYTPMLLVEYFYKRKTMPESITDSIYNVYLETINGAQVKLFINKTTDMVDKIAILENDDLLGNVNSTFEYHNYLNYQSSFIPQDITISRINKKLKDTIHLESFKTERKLPILLKAPANYALKEDAIETPSITVDKYNEHISFLYLKHTDSKTMVVEFKDFLLVAEAPLNTENGDLIIDEIRKHISDKPIKYFTFSHYHPLYIGGVRSFIHEKSIILCPIGNLSYVNSLTINPHTLKPDCLELDRQNPKVNIITNNKKTVSDGNYSMEIINIKDKSHHTEDYLVFYFPEEKVLFEGDLVHTPENNQTSDNEEEIGLYEAIKSLNLDVETILQSTPITKLSHKSEISYKELEQLIKN